MRTRRLVVRNLQPDDVTPAYPIWLNDPEINRFLEQKIEHTIDTCREYIESCTGQEGRSLLGIFLQEPQLHLGNITFSRIDWERRFAIVGITLGRKEFMGKGLAKEAMLAVQKYCFERLGLHRLQAHVAEGNLRSISFFLTCGFKVEANLRESEFLEGQFQSVYIFGILEDEMPDIEYLRVSW